MSIECVAAECDASAFDESVSAAVLSDEGDLANQLFRFDFLEDPSCVVPDMVE